MQVPSSMKNQRGFTIVELLIVIVVIAILAAITIVAYNGIQNRAKTSALLSSVSQGVKKVQAYAALNNDNYPADATAAGLTGSAGTTYTVSSNNTSSPKQYCVTVSSNNLTYFQTSAMSQPAQGTCISLLAWWPFNGNASDMSGNGADGTVNGATLTTGATGATNGAYQLGESGQYITVGSPSILSNVPANFTYTIWLARTGTASTQQWPLIMGPGSNNTHLDFGIRTNGYGVNVYFEWGVSPFDGVAYASSGTNGPMPNLNEWHHIAVSFNGTSIQIYWDGVLKFTSPATTIRPVMMPLQFTTATGGWSGKIDDARVYGRALSASEVQTMYSVGAQ